MKGKGYLIALLGVVLAGCLSLSLSVRTKPFGEYQTMLAAAQRTQRAYALVRERRLELQAPPDRADDPNDTGLIGPMFTGITTTQGLLEAKRTTTNPNTGALMVRLLHEAGVRSGDTVGVNMSSSFPAVNIALLCALEEMGVRGIVFSSIGSSTYGATLPTLTYPDMEQLLLRGGLISQQSCYLSLGGSQDLGQDMDPESVKQISDRLREQGYQFLSFTDFAENLDFRYQYYMESQVTCFINIGGNLPSFGGSSLMTHLEGGVVTSLPLHEAGDGLIQRFLSASIPVVNLLGMKDIYTSYGLPIDPIPIPDVGEGGVYFKASYSKPLALLFLVVSGGLLWKLWQSNRRQF